MNRKEVPRHSTLKVIYAAILATLGIAISKYIAAEIKFHDGLDVQELEVAIDRVEEKTRKKDPTIERIFLEADSLRPSRRPPQAA